jgi:hypothetical protein
LLRKAHSEIIKSTVYSEFLNFEDMDPDELLEMYGSGDFTGAELLYHANSDFLQLVENLVAKSIDSFYTTKYD